MEDGGLDDEFGAVEAAGAFEVAQDAVLDLADLVEVARGSESDFLGAERDGEARAGDFGDQARIGLVGEHLQMEFVRFKFLAQ